MSKSIDPGLSGLVTPMGGASSTISDLTAVGEVRCGVGGVVWEVCKGSCGTGAWYRFVMGDAVN